MTWKILYRGPLSSCNYDCDYCPFAKTKNTSEELADDQMKLESFVDWVENQQQEIELLLTPWGEALHHPYYQQALIRLSHLPNIRKVAIQTNLAASLQWVKNANQKSLAFWATYHPSQVTMDQFLKRSSFLTLNKISHSVGIVGMKEHFDVIEQLKKRLPKSVYLWVNAYKREKNYYQSSELELLNSIDPLFHHNNQYHHSQGKACYAGESSFSIDGNGDVFRCHFIKKKIANIYQNDLAHFSRESKCSNTVCGCHIGYVHLKHLNLYETFGDRLMERAYLGN